MRAFFVALPLLGMVAFSGVPATAQQDADAVARQEFQNGRSAFANGDYQEALRAFQRSYELSGRGELQYNIGLAADRLRRDEEALAAFESYLEQVDPATREVEVRERIRALRRSMSERELALMQTVQVNEELDAPRPKRKRAIAGPVVLGVVGLAGLGAMTAGLVKDGSCVATDASGNCIEQDNVNTTAVAVYGALGAAALVGGVLWFSLSGRQDTTVSFGPGTVNVRGTF